MRETESKGEEQDSYGKTDESLRARYRSVSESAVLKGGKTKNIVNEGELDQGESPLSIGGHKPATASRRLTYGDVLLKDDDLRGLIIASYDYIKAMTCACPRCALSKVFASKFAESG